MASLIPIERIERCIYLIREHKVMLDEDLAALYAVSTKVLNQAVKRNQERFPADFSFQLSREEADFLRSQIVTLKAGGRGRHRKYLPHVFTEQGVAMLSSVLNSERAIQVNIAIMRAFIKLREVLASRRELAAKLDSIERRITAHDAELGEHAKQLRMVFSAIRELMAPPQKVRKKIGFKPRGS